MKYTEYEIQYQLPGGRKKRIIHINLITPFYSMHGLGDKDRNLCAICDYTQIVKIQT